MVYEIVWTSVAWENYLSVLFYLREHWNDKVTSDFIEII